MFETIIDQDIFLSEDTRLIKRVEKTERNNDFPKGIRFALQYLYFKNNEWQQLVRIDNHLHQGKSGIHVHLFKRKEVIFEDTNFEEAERKIIEMGEKLKGTIK